MTDKTPGFLATRALMLPLLVLLHACGAEQPEAKKSADPYASTYRPMVAQPTLLTGATLLTGDGGRIESGDVMLADGRITAVGTALEPGNATVVDARGRWITPGLIDVHSHLGVYPAPFTPSHQDGNEMTGAVTAAVWAEHSVWPQDPGFPAALAGGVTSLQVLPGSANLIGGRGVTLKNIPGRSVMEMKFPGAPHGLKMACGENPKAVYGGQGQAPATRMGNVAGFRETWAKAAAYREKLAAAERGEGEAPDRDLAMETLVAALDGEIIVHNHCYRADEMAIMLALAREFGFRIAAFHHAVEAYKISDLLAEAGTCSAVWADWWGFKMEALDGIRENAALLDGAGACAIIHSDSEYGIQRLTQEVAKVIGAAARNGVDIPPERALRWVTENAARSLGIDSLTGTLTAGKMADVVVWSDNPFSVYARVEAVYVDGALVYTSNAAGPAPISDFSLGQNAETARTEAPNSAPEAGPIADQRSQGDTSPENSATTGPVTTAAATFAELRSVITATLNGHTSFIIRNTTLHTGGTSATLTASDVLVRDGRIEGVGQNLAIPDGLPALDGTRLRVTPGLFAAAGQIGLGEIELAGDPGDAQQRGHDFGAGFDVADAFNPRSLQIVENRIEGVLHAVLAPTPGAPDDGLEGGGVLNGLVAVASLGTPFEAPRRGAAVAVTLGEMGAWVGGGSRTAALLTLRRALDEARDYAVNRDAWRRSERRDYANSVADLEALQSVLTGAVPLLVRVDRASDIRTLVALAQTYGLRVIIEGGAEAWLEAGALAAANVPVILSPALNLPNSFDHLRARRGAAADLAAAGVRIAFTDPDATGHNARNLRQMAGIAVADGLDWDAALRAITLTPAEIYGSAATTGSIEPGKAADLVLWAGDPLQPASLPVGVVAEGALLDHESRQTELRDRYAAQGDARPPAWRH